MSRSKDEGIQIKWLAQGHMRGGYGIEPKMFGSRVWHNHQITPPRISISNGIHGQDFANWILTITLQNLTFFPHPWNKTIPPYLKHQGRMTVTLGNVNDSLVAKEFFLSNFNTFNVLKLATF
jgi:hypothetical protein